MSRSPFFSLLLFLLLFCSCGDSSIKNINFESWILIGYQAVIVSLFAHMSMFYLYKFYTIGQIFPFYSLFPIFGIILTFFIFGEIPSLLFFIGSFIINKFLITHFALSILTDILFLILEFELPFIFKSLCGNGISIPSFLNNSKMA